MEVLIKKLNDTAILPSYATEGSAGFDLVANNFKDVSPDFAHENSITLGPNARTLIGIGLSTKIPMGYELQIRPRSGLALKKGITVLNSPGTIDSDYTGEIGVILYNTSNTPVVIHKGDKIAQAVLCLYGKASFIEVSELPKTSRGDGGFGSTDNKNNSL